MNLNFCRRTKLFTVYILILGMTAQILFSYRNAYAAGTGGEINTVAGGDYGDSGDGGPAIDAELYNPSAIAVDGSGNLYIADTGNNKVRKVGTDGIIITVAGTGDYGYSGDGNPALNAQLRNPAGVAVDAAGNLYIADKYNNRIRKVAPNGIISTIAGTGENDYSGDGSLAVAAKLSSPGGVAVDAHGNVYIADTSNGRIRKVDAAGIITTVAGKSDYGSFSGDGGPAVDADLNRPQTVAIDRDGNLYIADTDNNRIRKVDTSGIISTVAGSSETDGYSGDGGPAVNAQLYEPEGVMVDGSGNLYISDTDNNRIRKVISNGNIITIAGTGENDYSGDGGPGILAKLNGPIGLAMDAGGNLYIADMYNYAIRKQTLYIPSDDASLSNITLSSGTLSPAFAPGTTAYSASVVNGVSSIRVTPTTADSLITVEVNGEHVASGSQSGDITLDVGENTITLVALAEDGVTTKTYTITVERLRSSNANLSQLSLSSGTLTPAFAPNTTNYSANAVQSAITVIPALADDMATVEVNGAAVANGTASQPIPLAVGSNLITVKVTAQDNTTTKAYRINVTRTISANADLSGLTLSSGTLSPSFEAETTGYTASVGNDVSSIAVTATTVDSSAAVTVNDVPVASGEASAALMLVVGSNPITVKVTAENGTIRTYTVTVTRAASSNADLSDLELSNGVLTPSFLAGTYKASVGNSVSGVSIRPTVSDPVHATVTVSLYNGSGTLVSGPLLVASGTSSPSLALDVGNNTISLLVTAEDGTTKMYTVTVTRGASANAELSNLTLSGGTLTPAFGGTYTSNVGNSVSSITVTATVADAVNALATAYVYDAVGALSGGPYALMSGEASPSLPLSVGKNTITVIVTAQDNTTRTYTITVTRAASRQPSLSGLALSAGILSPAFEPDTTRYTASVDANVPSVTVTMTVPDADKSATTTSVYNSTAVLINGPFTMPSGTAAFSIPLKTGSNAISIIVTAQDGTTKTYMVSIVRAEPSTTPPVGGGSGNSNGGASSSGGSSSSNGSTAAVIPEKEPNQPVTAMIPVTAAAGEKAAANGIVPDKAIADAIVKAQADAKAQSKTANGIAIELNVTLPKGAASLSLVLSQNALQSLVNAGATSFTINSTPLPSVCFGLNALKEIQKQSSGNVTVSIAPVKNLSADAKKLIGTRPVYDITVSFIKDGKTVTVSTFNSGIVTISIPYTVGKKEAAGCLYGVYVDDKGNASRIAGSAYDGNSRSILIPTGHLSAYGAGYTPPDAKFTDISSHWGKESIDYVVGRGLLAGTSDTAFSPNTSLTRGMLVTALGRLAEVDTKLYKPSSFTDVKPGSEFQPYTEWAYKNGVVQDIGNSQFAPDRAITREEIAVIFANHAKATGYTLPVTREAAAFADASSIGSSCTASVKAMQQAGIMMGGRNNKFNSKSNVTRAEASAMLHRYIKLTIDPSTAQAWALNDDGQFMYYKDGKSLTGWQTIAGARYCFNIDGSLQIGWVKDGDNWRFYDRNRMVIGWWNADGKQYYFTKEGFMVAGKWLEIAGKWYYFCVDGSLAKNTRINDYEVDESGVRKMK
jgi:sugar lactone lactonase YvrE